MYGKNVTMFRYKTYIFKYFITVQILRLGFHNLIIKKKKNNDYDKEERLEAPEGKNYKNNYKILNKYLFVIWGKNKTILKKKKTMKFVHHRHIIQT